MNYLRFNDRCIMRNQIGGRDTQKKNNTTNVMNHGSISPMNENERERKNASENKANFLIFDFMSILILCFCCHCYSFWLFFILIQYAIFLFFKHLKHIEHDRYMLHGMFPTVVSAVLLLLFFLFFNSFSGETKAIWLAIAIN